MCVKKRFAAGYSRNLAHQNGCYYQMHLLWFLQWIADIFFLVLISSRRILTFFERKRLIIWHKTLKFGKGGVGNKMLYLFFDFTLTWQIFFPEAVAIWILISPLEHRLLDGQENHFPRGKSAFESQLPPKIIQPSNKCITQVVCSTAFLTLHSRMEPCWRRHGPYFTPEESFMP